MSRRKGERTARQNERECPNIVELPVPPGGFGKRLDEIFAFHRQLGIPDLRGNRQRRADQEFVRWCFKDREHADAFAARFGGSLVAE